PMELEEGRYSSLYISVQPSGTIFDPPLEVTFPNLDQLPANSVVLLMSFDHDAGRYVQVGTGRVSLDGKQITSDPGSGIRVGAWQTSTPPLPSPTTTLTGDSQGCMCMVWANGTQAIPIGSSSVSLTSPSNLNTDNINALADTTIMTTKYRANVPSNGISNNLQAQCLDCPDINFVRQKGIVNSLTGDEVIEIADTNSSCLMVSKFKTDEDLKDKYDIKPTMPSEPPAGNDTDSVRIQLTSKSLDQTPVKHKIRIEVIRNNAVVEKSAFDIEVKLHKNANNQTIYKTEQYYRLVSNDIDDDFGGNRTIKKSIIFGS
ncbi:MAG: hypothetical protein FD167_2732, partial [bacterium]